jgi:hypothetical protein
MRKNMLCFLLVITSAAQIYATEAVLSHRINLCIGRRHMLADTIGYFKGKSGDQKRGAALWLRKDCEEQLRGRNGNGKPE